MWNRHVTILPDESMRSGLLVCEREMVINAITFESGFSFAELSQKNRKQPIVICRHLIAYFLSVNTNLTFYDISSVFGKTHATAINSVRATENMMLTNREFRLRIIRLSDTIINHINQKHEEESAVNR